MRTESKSFSFKERWIDLAFFVAVVLIFFLFGYYDHFSDGPGGFHYIRQTDSLAFIDHYQDNGNNFFKPGTLNLDSEDGNAACEFPILYYFISFLYGVFGKHYFFLRMINLGIVLFGMYHLLALTNKIVKDKVYALLITLFLFTSTIFGYYIFNFLPDAAALGLTLIGWNLIYDQYDSKNPKWYKPFIFFTIAGLIKVTYFISPIAIVGFYVVQNFRKKDLTQLKSLIITFGIALFLIAGWNIYVLLYNQYFNTEYFTTGARQIWGMPQVEVSKTWDHIFNFWFQDYFAHSSHHFLWALLAFQLILLKRMKEYAILTLLLYVGALCYFLLFFSQFKDHDYYALTLMPIIVAALISGVKVLSTFKNQSIQITFKTVFSIITLVGINYAAGRIKDRFDRRIDQISMMGIHLESISGNVKAMLPEDCKPLLIQDPSKNGGLISIDRKGWTLPVYEDFTEDTLDYYLENGLTHIISQNSTVARFKTLEQCYPTLFKDSLITIFEIQ